MGFLFLWSFDGGGFVSEARDWEEEAAVGFLSADTLHIFLPDYIYQYFVKV